MLGGGISMSNCGHSGGSGAGERVLFECVAPAAGNNIKEIVNQFCAICIVYWTLRELDSLKRLTLHDPTSLDLYDWILID